MSPEITVRQVNAATDEQYTKVFFVCGEDASSRRCLICEQVFSRQESFEHSKFPCHPPASIAN